MLDYVPMEIVEYAEFEIEYGGLDDYRNYNKPISELTSDYVYSLRGYYGTYTGLGGRWSNSTGKMVCSVTLISQLGANFYYPYNGYWREYYEKEYGIYELPIYAIQLTTWNGVSVSDFPVCYVAAYTPNMSAHSTPTLRPESIFNKITEDDCLLLGLPINGTFPDFTFDRDPLHESLFWLYQFGGVLPGIGVLSSILNFQIPLLNVNFITFLFGGGFIVYCTFVVLKFFIR